MDKSDELLAACSPLQLALIEVDLISREAIHALRATLPSGESAEAAFETFRNFRTNLATLVSECANGDPMEAAERDAVKGRIRCLAWSMIPARPRDEFLKAGSFMSPDTRAALTSITGSQLDSIAAFLALSKESRANLCNFADDSEKRFSGQVLKAVGAFQAEYEKRRQRS